MALLDDNAESRTAPPTERRRRQARERGQVAHSTELLVAARLLGIWITLAGWCGTFVVSASSLLRTTFDRAGSTPLEPSLALLQLRDLAWQILSTASWPLLTVTTLVVIAHFAQVGWLWRWDNLLPDSGRMSPVTGLQRLSFGTTTGRGLKLVLKLAIVLGTISFVVWTTHPTSSSSSLSDLTESATQFGSATIRLGSAVALVMLTFGALDYLWQRRRHERSLQMTPDELREELKESEGKASRLALSPPSVPPTSA